VTPFRAFSSLLAAALLLAALPALTLANEGAVPVNISSNSMRYSASGQEVVFEGKVQVSRPDFQIWAEKIIIHLTPKKKTGEDSGPGVSGLDPGAIEKIVASGGVRMAHKGKTGTCQTATYNVRDGVFIMEGKPSLEEGKNRIEGQVIKFFIKENRSEVVGGDKQRVNATFFAPQKIDGLEQGSAPK